jgi:NDP-sugar pyrophosphorylase family protein
MKAIIFAAGLGTRLGVVTQATPKALVQLNGEPLLYHAIHKLKTAGVNELVINVHHFSDQVIQYLLSKSFGLTIHISDESGELLDTGGGLKKARPWLDGEEPFIAWNVDVISSLDLTEVVGYHNRIKPLATLVVRKRNTSRYFLFDQDMQLVGWKNSSTGEEVRSRPTLSPSENWAFSGIQVISPAIFDLIDESGKFSVTTLYLRLAKQYPVAGYPDSSEFWLDLGKPGQIEEAEKLLAKIGNR